ncbi:hypothetical protein BATDEDRAFT_26976 [Batrachochytrium dendrobatidis JAM81]|uniref:Uncharacterized protein n=1 Tax=Batrachochytrium dendrobatidis (strain JAM81 / FGSC 10211) TaxID=684364 RepID=F4P8R6_BATDJ|nr:uncharacterized protein BATDEDRAFT_26976 [Batrachochytrium dendrobatidis JAM81]EGF78361.1 hypothetical protein BATDEDRAFT_26976 [Batrachochytrium dendrobatidis JAM81]|eukprot:XP_006681108.1 hypothetical protein BATDEDRAFT_26976 [Batrachochytrium dendrobatidis JAM81]
MAHLCPDGCQAHVLFPVSSLEKLTLGRYHASELSTNRNQRHTHSITSKRQVDRTNNTFINANIDESYYLDLPGEYKRQSDSGHTVGRHNKLLIYQHMVTKVKSAVTKLTVMLGLKSGKVIYCVKLDTPYFKPNNKHRLYRQHQDITGPLCSITDML